jgi:hypothetical protein
LEVFGNDQKNKSGKTMPVKDTIQSRRGSSAQWSAANPILADGEIGYDSTTKQMKVGDGVTAWNALAYLDISATNLTTGTLPDARLSAKVKSLADLATPASTQLLAMNGSGAVVDGTSTVNDAVAAQVTTRAALLATTTKYIRDLTGEYRLSSDQVSATDNVFRIARTDGSIIERIWDGVRFNVEWVPMGVQVGDWGVTSSTINGDKLTAAAHIIPSGCILELQRSTTYNVDFPMRISRRMRINGNGATIKRAPQRASLLTANSNSGTTSVTVADASVFRVGMRAFVVKTAGVVGGHAMVNGTSVTYGSGGFIIASIVGNVVTFGEALQQNCVIGNKLVALEALIIADVNNLRTEIKDITFDGDNANHSDVLDWAAGYGVNLGRAKVENCTFTNMPNENLTIGAGVVRDCYGENLNGSFFHSSISGNGSEARGLLVQNCQTVNTNTKDSGHSEGVITFSANSRNIRVKDCVFDNSGGIKGQGVFGTLDAVSANDKDDNFLAENVVAKNFSAITLSSVSTGVNMERLSFSKCKFESCGMMQISAADVTNGPYIGELNVRDCEFVNCWVDLRGIRYINWQNNVYRWELHNGPFCGVSGTFAGLPTTRLDGTSVQNGDACSLVFNDGSNTKGIYIRTAGVWVRDAVASANLPLTSVGCALYLVDCGNVNISGGYMAGPGFKPNDTFNVGILPLVQTFRKTESGTTTVAYMDVHVSNIDITGFQAGIATRLDAWWAVPVPFDTASWTFDDVRVYTFRDNLYAEVLGIEVPAGASATNCKVYMSDRSTSSAAIGIRCSGPIDATKTIGGAAIGCYVPVAPGSSQAIRLGMTSDNVSNKNCVAVGNVIAKSVAIAGTHDSVQANNTVISISGMTSPTIPPWRPVGANESLY